MVTLLGGLAMSTGAVIAAEPFPTEHCTVHQGSSPTGLGVALAYGIVLGERTRTDNWPHEEFMVAMTDLQNVTRLMMVDLNAEAACQAIMDIEDTYGLERPDLDSLPQNLLD